MAKKKKACKIKIFESKDIWWLNVASLFDMHQMSVAIVHWDVHTYGQNVHHDVQTKKVQLEKVNIN